MEQLHGVARLLSEVCYRNHMIVIGKGNLTALFQTSNRTTFSFLSMLPFATVVSLKMCNQNKCCRLADSLLSMVK